MNRQFPPEIVQLIVEASLDPYDFFAQYPYQTKLRYATLKLFSVLNSAWCGSSQAELVKLVVIRTEGSAKIFLDLAQQRGGTLGGLQDMFVNSVSFTDASTLAKLLRSVPQVVDLRLRSATADIGDLARLQQLRRLELFDCSVVGSASSSLLRLPQLQRLEISYSRVLDSARQFLTPAVLPQLRRVKTDFHDEVASLVPQLEIITFVSGHPEYALLARAKSLLLLPLPHYAHKRLDMLAKLPSFPPFLHIDITPHIVDDQLDDNQELLEALEDLLETSKSGLPVILLNDHGISDRIGVLIQRFEERGVRVQLGDHHLDFEGAIVEMEKIRKKEKRAAEAAVIGVY